MAQIERFNEGQLRRLLASFKYVDKLLQDIEEVLVAASTETAFPRYKNALSPTQIRISRDYITRVRRQMLRAFAGLEIPIPPAPFDSVHAIRVTLQFIEIALEECSPDNLAGYGRVPPGLIAPLTGALQEIKTMAGQLDAYVAQGIGRDLEGRLERLSATGDEVELIRKLREVIDRQGLVEFRGVLSGLVEKLESPAYEIAVFGRVSSGKSSLLNRIIGLDVLPVGVTPVTAIPTRIRNGEREALWIWFAGGRHEERPIQDVDTFVTEEENPGNEKQVTKILLEIASSRLPAGVTLVDTPGLGSLALAGATETLAYLPRCDLGVVVVDSSSSLTPEDIGTVQKLYEAATPAVVVLSKIDLVRDAERIRLVDYTGRKIQEELGIKVPISPLSSRGEFEALLDDWMAQQIAPRYARAQELANESVKRKAGALREALVAVLERMSGRLQPAETSESVDRLSQAETELRLASGAIETIRNTAFQITDRIRLLGPEVPGALAQEALTLWKRNQLGPVLEENWVKAELVGLAKSEGEELVKLIHSTAQNLSGALDTAARALPGQRVQDRLDLRGSVKNMPVPEPKIAPFTVRRPLAAISFLRLSHRQIEGRIRAMVGPQISDFFTDHGRMLESWVRSALSDLESLFEEQAENYRAQLQRTTKLTAMPEVDRSSIEGSLAMLRAPDATAEPQASREL